MMMMGGTNLTFKDRFVPDVETYIPIVSTKLRKAKAAGLR